MYEVHASVWWPIIYTNYVQTIIYTVEEGSGSTIGSHTEYVNATALSKIDYGVNFSTYSPNSLLSPPLNVCFVFTHINSLAVKTLQVTIC